MKLPLHHYEPNLMGMGLPDTLFYTKEPANLAIANGVLPLRLPKGSSFSPDTLRNSLFTQSLGNLNDNYTINLDLDAEGSFDLVVYSETLNGAIKPLISRKFSNHIGTATLPFFVMQGANEIGRFFFNIRSYGALIKSAYFSTEIAGKSLRKTLFLLRTFGNTEGIISSLKRLESHRFWDAYPDSKHIFLDNSIFCVYDSTPNCEESLTRELSNLNMNCHAWVGPNLGGGGNASLNLLLAKKLKEQNNIDLNDNFDYVILDDDVCASPETLYRTFAINQIRKSDLTFGSPIFMQSQPQRLWENGGCWGKEFSKGLETFTSVSPQLGLHGTYFSHYEHLSSISKPSSIDYTTFNLFSFSSEMQEKVGFPAAYFLRGDDIDYSIRCKKIGQLTTIPNLAVWQEPAHSYWQEYMAYMHGLIVNITHGGWREKELQSHLQSKLLEHSVHNDLFGVKVYSCIIEDMFSTPLVLSDDFAELYLSRRKYFAGFENKFSASVDPNQSYRSQEIQTLNFIAPSACPDMNKTMVALFWPTKKSYYLYNRNDHILRAAVSTELVKCLEKLNDTDNVKSAIDKIKSRYEITKSQNYWENMLKNYDITHLLSGRYDRSITANSEDEKNSNVFSFPDEVIEPAATNIKDLQLRILKETFDPTRYLELNTDVADADIDPLEHYIEYGMKEGRPIV